MTFEDFDREDLVKLRLTAFIHPKTPVTPVQKKAFKNAIAIQAEYEDANDPDDSALPGGVESVSIGDFSVSAAAKASSEYNKESLHPAAWALLYSTGLIPGAIPQARRV